MKEYMSKFEAAGAGTEAEEKFINFRLSPEDFEVAKIVHERDKEKFVGMVERKAISLSPEQEQYIRFAEEELLNILKKYSIDYPPALREETVIAFLSKPDYEAIVKDKDSDAVYIPERNIILMQYLRSYRNKKNQGQFLNAISHELVHAKSFRSLQAFKNKERKVDTTQHRSGLSITKLGRPEKELFNELNEGITDAIARELTENIINGRRGEFKETIYSQIKRVTRKDSQESEKLFDEGYHYTFPQEALSYDNEVALFEFLVDALSAHSKEYKNKPGEIKTMFYNAYFSGSMQKIGRLIDETFGRGAFRMIAEQPFDDPEKKTFENLKIRLSIPRR